MGRNVHTSSLRIPIFRTRSPHIPFSNAYLSLRSDDAIRWLIEKKNYTYSIGSLSHRTWDRLSSVVFSIELAVLSNLSFIRLFDGGLQCKFIRTFSIRLYRANEPCSVEKNRRGCIFFLNYYGNRDSWNVRTFAFN